ncbi:hypothetical protein [Phenylobacterium sp.]|jgi:hypothetical protein|uniref:hypothetical protein n=1 Tax=Phenylobacterium sp. TaxID=1871053 RepID=UPI002F3F9DE0
MAILIDLLLWLHFLALAMGVGGGLAMSQVGPRLIAAAPAEREPLWPLATVYSRIAGGGLVLLLITGPLLLWLKFGGMGGLNDWFRLKLALVAVSVVTIGLSEWGLARLKRGDEGGGRLMRITGPLTLVTVLAIVLAAVFAFN